jgi:hypothetical protein
MAPSPRAQPASDAAARLSPGTCNGPETSNSPSLSFAENRRRPPPPLELNREAFPWSRATRSVLDSPASRPQGGLVPSRPTHTPHAPYTSASSPSRGSRPELPSSHEEMRAQGIAGLGLVLPYESSHSPSSNTYRDGTADLSPVPSSPMGGRTSRSPSADRTRLIGLGELATPRWTTRGNVLNQSSAGDDWESDVVRGYDSMVPVGVILMAQCCPR